MAAIAQKVIAVRVPQALDARLQRLAAEENTDLSAVTRRLLTQALNQIDADVLASIATPRNTRRRA